MFVNADNKWSFDQLLYTPLPEHQAASKSISVSQKDKDRHTHPSSVQYWLNWEADVKDRLQQADIQVNDVIVSGFWLVVVARPLLSARAHHNTLYSSDQLCGSC